MLQETSVAVTTGHVSCGQISIEIENIQELLHQGNMMRMGALIFFLPFYKKIIWYIIAYFPSPYKIQINSGLFRRFDDEWHLSNGTYQPVAIIAL